MDWGWIVTDLKPSGFGIPTVFWGLSLLTSLSISLTLGLRVFSGVVSNR